MSISLKYNPNKKSTYVKSAVLITKKRTPRLQFLLTKKPPGSGKGSRQIRIQYGSGYETLVTRTLTLRLACI